MFSKIGHLSALRAFSGKLATADKIQAIFRRSAVPQFVKSTAVILGVLSFAASPSWAAGVFPLDHFAVDLNGAPLFADDFADGNPLPSSPAYIGSAFVPGYTVFSKFCTPAPACSFPVNPEVDGKLNLSVVNGVPTYTANGLPAILQSAILRTPAADAAPPAPARSLNSADTFKVSGLYDYRNPDGPTEQYRVSVTDRTSAVTAGDVFSIAVMRAQFPEVQNPSAITPTYCGSVGGDCNVVLNAGTGELFTNLNGQVVVAIYKQDFVTNELVIVEARPIDLTGNPDQIRLTIEKSSSGSAISTSFTYVKNGIDLSTVPFTNTSSVFNYNTFTRPEFGAVQIETLTTTAAAKLTTGSPASISQTVSEVTSNNLQFQYRFSTTSGFLTVALNGVELGVINAPSAIEDMLTTVNFDTSAFVGILGALLTFTLDGPTGSSILLDNIVFGNLANGDFQTGNLSAWTAAASGAGSVGVEITVQETPLPAALPLFAAGLGAIGLLAARRRKRTAANSMTR